MSLNVSRMNSTQKVMSLERGTCMSFWEVSASRIESHVASRRNTINTYDWQGWIFKRVDKRNLRFIPSSIRFQLHVLKSVLL